MADPHGEKAERLIDAMRDSVIEVGIAGSTFERVAAKAGVSRGLVHYYFGTKERLLVEVVRRDAEVRSAALEIALVPTRSAAEVAEVLVANLRDLVAYEPGYMLLVEELFVEARNNTELREELAEHYRRARAQAAAVIRRKQLEGVIAAGADVESVMSFLLAVADGCVIQMLADDAHDHDGMLEAVRATATYLLSASVTDLTIAPTPAG